MPIELKEYVGAEYVQLTAPMSDISSIKEGYTQTYIDENSLMVDIEAIHSVITRNDTYYTPACIKESVRYWTAPYERPVIMHHNERDGVIIGRVKAAKYIERSERSGTPALELTTNIGDEEGKKGVKNGTLATVSIGAIAHDIECSICGQNLVKDGLCEHDRGEIYDNKRCYWIINKMEPKEISYVVVPSDTYAHNINIYDAVKKNKNNEVKESMNNIFADLMETHGLSTAESKPTTNTQEGTQMGEEVKDGVKVGEQPEEPKKEPEKTEEPKKEPEAKKADAPEQVKDSKENEDPVEPKGEAGAVADTPEKTEEPKPEEPKKEPEKTEDNKELESENVELKKKVAELEAKVQKLTDAVASEKALKESAETQLLQFRTEKKKTLVETINSLRTQLSLPQENMDSLVEYSEESLNTTIKSLQEFVQVQKKTLAGLSVIESPVAVSEEKDNTNSEKKDIKSVKESTHSSNNNFELDLMSLMSKCF